MKGVFVYRRLCRLVFALCAFSGCASDLDTFDSVSSLRKALAPDADPVRGRDLLLNNGTPASPYLSCGIPRRLVSIAAGLRQRRT